MNRWLLLIILGLLWAPSFLFIKIGLHDIPPLTLASARLGLAGIILYGALRLGGGRLPTTWAVWRKFLVMGLFASAFPFAMFSVGEQYADSTMASILNGATPIFTALLAHFFVTEERLTSRKLAGVLTAFGGIVLIFLPGLAGGLQNKSVWGLLAFAAAAVSYGISIVYARNNLRGLPPLVGPTAQLVTGTSLLLPVAIALEWPVTQAPGLPAIGSVLFLAIFGTAIAYVVYYRLLEIASATFLSLVTYFLPPTGVLLGMIFLDEELGWNAIAGSVLVILGVLVVNDVLRRIGGRSRSARGIPVPEVAIISSTAKTNEE